jgi:peptidyl-prolyl cis-trans isomerase C
LNPNKTTMTKHAGRRVARVALVASVAAALSLPILTQHLRAQDSAKTAPAAAGAGAPGGAKPLTASPKVDPKTVIASAGEVQVTAGEFDSFLQGLPPQQQAQVLGSAEGRKQLADHLVKMKAMTREAEKRKLDQDPKVKEQIEQVQAQLKAQMESARQNVLVQNLVQSLQGDEAGDKKFFEEHPESFGKVTARHILVSTRGSGQPGDTKPALTDEQAKKKADDIRARLVKGEDFAAIAKAESDDPGSKNTGGEYTFGRGEMVPAFEETAFGMKEKEISQPVKTQFGYHVIQLQKRLPGTYEEAKNTIPRHRLEAFVKSLVPGEVKFNDAFINAAAAPAPAGNPAGPEGAGAPPAPAAGK